MSNINQSPTVLLHHANELIQDILEDHLLGNDSLQEAWLKRAFAWAADYGSYLNRENGDI